MLCRDKRPTAKPSSTATNNSKLHSPLHVCNRQCPHSPPSKNNLWHCAHRTSDIPTWRGQKGAVSFQTTSIHMYSEVSQCLAMQHSKIPMTAVFFWTCKLYLQQVFIFFSCLSFVFTMEKPLLIFSCSLFSCDTSMGMSFTLIIFTTGKNPSWGEDDAKAHHSFREKMMQVSCWLADPCYVILLSRDTPNFIILWMPT